MTDHRPRYGELATPEEQRRAAGLPPLDKVVIDPAPAPQAGLAEVPPTAQGVEPATRRRPVDRLVTIALLAYGLVNVVVTGIGYLDLTRVMNEAMAVVGVEGEFTNYAQGRLWGVIAAIVLVAGWVVTAVIALRRLRGGRLAWWVAIVGAVVTGLIVSFCLAIPMMGDPAFSAFVNGVGAP